MSVIFDEAGALDRVAGDKELLIELFDIAFEDSAVRIAQIEKAIISRDGKLLSEYAHAMKSAFGNIGAMACHSVAFDLEKIGKSGNLDGVMSHFENFKQQITLFKRISDSFRNL